MTISTEQRHPTPIERAQAALEAVQANISRLEHEQHLLDDQRAAARQANDNDEHERLSDLFRANNIALRTATGGRLPDAKQALVQAQEQLRRARSRASETTNAIKRIDTDLQALASRLQSLGAERLAAQTAQDAAQTELLALEPPAPPVAAPDEPTPVVEAAPPALPEFEPPTRTLSLMGMPTRYFNADDIETDRAGRPLAAEVEPSSGE